MMAIAEDRLQLDQITDVVQRKWNSLLDSEALQNVKALADKIGSTIKALGDAIREGIGHILQFITNTRNTINDALALFEDVACRNIDPLDIRIPDYMQSLFRALDFNINLNMCNGGLSNNPIASILKGIRSGDKLSSIWDDVKSAFLDTYMRNKIDNIARQLGIGYGLTNNIFNKAKNNALRENYNRKTPLRNRADLANFANQSLAGKNFNVTGSKLSTAAKVDNTAHDASLKENIGSLPDNKHINIYIITAIVDGLDGLSGTKILEMLKQGEKSGLFSREEILKALIAALNLNDNDLLKKLELLDKLANQDNNPYSKLFSLLDAKDLYDRIRNNPLLYNGLTNEQYKKLLGLLNRLDDNWSIDKNYYHLKDDPKLKEILDKNSRKRYPGKDSANNNKATTNNNLSFKTMLLSLMKKGHDGGVYSCSCDDSMRIPLGSKLPVYMLGRPAIVACDRLATAGTNNSNVEYKKKVSNLDEILAG